jgi:signal recognition particle subunit SRP54
MFDQLSDRLQATLSGVRARGKLTEADVDDTMREIRLALLEADVNFKVTKSFTAQLKERCMGAGVLDSLDPGQQVVKIVSEELAALMGGSSRDLALASQGPTVILMAGLQGSGKTTACAKLAKQLAGDGRKVGLVACDTQRPAAVEQLVTLGQRAGAIVYEQGTERDPVEIAEWALGQARSASLDALIVDTAGRLHIDQELMDQLGAIRKRTKPHDVLLVLDAMTGQEAVNLATGFLESVPLTGLVLTKLDGDTRGGAAISAREVTGCPIKFVGVGEGIDELDVFYPDRMASRILGMGDVLTLIEKAEQTYDLEQAERAAAKLKDASFDLDDFLEQFQQLKKMGPLQQLIGMLPGAGAALRDVEIDERQLARVEAIIRSMTPHERRNPRIIKGGRRRRIAEGSGTRPQDVNGVLRQFSEAQKMMKALAGGKSPIPGLALPGGIGRKSRKTR